MPPSIFSNIPFYQTLCKKLVEQKGQPNTTPAAMDKLFDVIGVQNTLTGLFLVLENFTRIAQIATQVCKKPKWNFASTIITEAEQTAGQLLNLRTEKTVRRITALGPRLEVDRNRTFHSWVEDNPRYATIGYLPPKREYSTRYLHLVAHLLIAHLLTVQQKQSDELDPLFESALQAARSLCTDDSLKFLPETPLSPESYIGRLPKISDQRQINAVTRYLSHTLALESTCTLKQLEKHLFCNPDQAVKYDPLQELYPDEPSTHQLPQVVEEPSRSSDEDQHLSSGQMVIVPRQNQTLPSGRSIISLAQGVAKARSRENQLFHFWWHRLNQYDLKVLFDFFLAEPRDFEEAKTRAQLLIMFVTGASSARLSRFKISDDRAPLSKEDFYLAAEGTLLLHTPGPQYSTGLDKAARKQACPTQNTIELKLPGFLHNVLSSYLRHGQQKDARCIADAHLFPDSVSRIQQYCQKSLSGLNSIFGTRLTLNKIQNHIPLQIAALAGSDLAAASLVLGKEIYLARTRIHYSGFDSETLGANWSRALLETARTAGLEISSEHQFPQEKTVYVGTPVRPRIQAVQELIDAVKTSLTQTGRIKTLESLVEFHNTYALYTVLTIFYSSAFRAVNSPFIHDHMLDAQTGFCVIRDKSAVDGYHSRLVWLPNICLKQLELFRQHVGIMVQLYPSFTLDFSRKDRVFFFLDPQGRRMRVSRSRIEEALKKFGFYLPANVQRHFIKSELQEDGCPSEIIEIFLGHWHHGEEAWTRESALLPGDYKEQIQKYLPALLRRLGLAPVRGLQRPPTDISLLLHQKTVEEKTLTPRQRQTRKDKQVRELLIQTPPGDVWFSVLGQRFRDLPADKAFKKEERTTLAMMHALVPELYKGEEGAIIAPEKLNKLLHRLRPRPMHMSAYTKRMTFLTNGLRWGQRHLAWNVELPTLPLILPKEKNRIRPPLMRKVKIFRELENLYIRDLERPLPADPHLRVAQILLSAIFYGGINEPSWAKAFTSGLQNSLHQYEDILWVDLWREPQNFASDEDKYLAQRNPEGYRRWLADPTTQLLIYRWLRYSTSDRQKTIYFNMHTVYLKYGQHIQATFGVYLPDLKTLLDVANARTTLHAPPFVSAYAEGKVNSASLPDPAWLRVISAKQYPHAAPKDNGPIEPQRVARRNIETRMQLGLLRQIRNIILHHKASGSRKALIDQLETFIRVHGNQMSPALVLLTQWGIQLFSMRVSDLELRKKTPESPTTVDTYLGQFSQEFLEICGSVDVIDLEADELSLLFEKVVEQIKRLKITNPSFPDKSETERVEYILNRLNQFFGYLYVFHGTAHLEARADGTILLPPGKAVRANLITPEEFGAIRTTLGWGNESLSRQEQMTLIAAILAFRTGMRVMEICGLQIGDIQGSTEAEVLVRPNRFRRLKTRASQRRLPIATLLPQNELEFVLKWHSYRSTELGATRTCALFARGPLDPDFCAPQELFRPITAAMRKVTGDSTVVPHTMRHSCATWLVMNLLMNNEGLENDLSALHVEEFAGEVQTRLKGSLLANETSGRKSLRAVAALLGHSDTDTLAHTYLHLTDWLWRHYSWMKINQPLLTTKALARILGCSDTYSRKILTTEAPRHLSHLRRRAMAMQKELEHPMVHHLVTRASVARAYPQKKLIDDFDKCFNEFCSSEIRPRHINLPKSQIEMYVIRHIWSQIMAVAKNQEKATARLCLSILKSYRHHDRAIIINDPMMAKQVMNLLEFLNFKYTVIHYTSRWEGNNNSSYSINFWRSRLVPEYIGRGTQNCGTKSTKGIVRLFIQKVDICGYETIFDDKFSNLFQIFLHIFSKKIS